MSDFSLIVIGCSAGGFDALKNLLPFVPVDMACSIAVVLHIGPHSENKLPELFRPLCKVPVKEAEDKEIIEKGTIYFAPSGYHLLVEIDRSFSLSLDEPVQYSRPSIDVLFESAAVALNKQVLGIILSGANSDGASGMKQILRCGGQGIVESPATARHAAMPQAVIDLNGGESRLSVLNLNDLRNSLIPKLGQNYVRASER